MKTLSGFGLSCFVGALSAVGLADVPDSTSYVQSGLVLQFDAIDNAGRNQHDPDATIWKDLVGSRDAEFYGTIFWGEAALTIKGKTGSGTTSTYARGTFDGTLTAAHTIEVCFKVIDGKNNARILGGAGTGAGDFPQLGVSTYDGATPEKCGLRLLGYGNTGVEVKNTHAYLDLANGETVSYSQTGTSSDGVEYYVNGRYYWKQTDITSACENTGAKAFLGNIEARNGGVDSEFYSVRIYNRVLTAAEREQNARVDQARYLKGPVEITGTTYIDAVNGDDENNGHEYRNLVTGETYTNAVKNFSVYYANVKSRDSDIAFMPGEHPIIAETRVTSGGVSGVTVRGLTGNPKDVVLVGNGTRFFYRSTNQSTNYLFSSMTFRNFSTTADSGNGGAICQSPGANVADGSSVSNCVFENCSAKCNGGAVYFYGRGGRVVDCVFDRCSCGGGNYGGGGGLYMDPMPNSPDPVLIKGCVFRDNFTTNLGVVANGGHGGGLFLYYPKDSRNCELTLEDCQFLRNHTTSGLLSSLNASNNFTSAGGALYGGVTRMRNCRFEGNWTDSTDPASKTNSAGGAWNSMSAGYDGLHIVVENCQFITNFCSGLGGAFYIWPDKTKDYGVTFSNCVFTGNSSTGNGAVSFMKWSGGGIRYVNFYDCLFNKNKAPAIGNASGTGYGTSGQVNSSDILSIISCNSEYVRCRFEDNVGYGRSSAMMIYDTDNNKGYHEARGYRIEDCIFRRNVIAVPPVARQKDTYGGALWIKGRSPTTNVVVRNCLFEGNVNSNYLGGTIYFEHGNQPFAQCAVENCTFVGNQAYFDPEKTMSNAVGPFGTPVFTKDPTDTKISNCLFADNHRVGDPTMVREVGFYTKSTFTNCLFKTASDPSGQSGIKLADGDQGCKVGYDPKFYDAAHGDYRIKRASPARDCGVESPWMREAGAHDLLVTNKFGKVSTRIYGPTVDLGCYEWRPTDGLMLFVR